MTSDNLTSKKARELLELYYAGNTTPAQEAALTRFFLTSTVVDDDLALDREIFLGLDSARQALPPDDLHARILKSTCGIPARRRRPTWMRAVAVAASMAVLATAGIGVMQMIQTSPGGQAADPADESFLTALVNHPDTILRVDTVVPRVVEPAPRMAKAAVKPAHSHRSAAATDSVDPAVIAQMLDGILAKGFSNAGAGIETARESFETIDKTINKISQ